MADALTEGELASAASSVDSALTLARARAGGARQGMDYTPPVRTGAFKASARHTSRVRLFKVLMIAGSALGVSAVAIVSMFNPFRHLPGSISLSGVGVSGTKITMDLPKITGVQQGGGPYEIRAKAGIQDITQPSIMDLKGVDASIGMADRTTTHVTSAAGTYDSHADTMFLRGDVKVANTSGYTLNLQTALVDFKAGAFTSHERLRVDLKGGEVMADDMAISNNGHMIAFLGNISSTFDPPEDVPPEPEQVAHEPARTRQAEAKADAP